MNHHQPPTLQQQREMCLIAQLGCDRTTARQYAGVSAAQLRQALRCDADFAQRLERAEAAAELHFMRNVHEAAKEEKNWRTSVWWLERRAPERYARRDVRAISAEAWAETIRDLAEALLAEIVDLTTRRRLAARLELLASAAQSVADPSPTAPCAAPPEDAELEGEISP